MCEAMLFPITPSPINPTVFSWSHPLKLLLPFRRRSAAFVQSYMYCTLIKESLHTVQSRQVFRRSRAEFLSHSFLSPAARKACFLGFQPVKLCHAVRRDSSGASVLIKMRCSANSSAIDFVRPTIPIRNVLESSKPGIGCLTDDEAILTMRPHPF